MKKQIAYLLITAALAAVPLTFTGCAVAEHQETAGQYTKDKEIAARVKTALYADPVTKGTEIGVTVLNGQVQLTGFVNSAADKERAAQIAASTPGVIKVYNDIVLPTGR